mmetsp:Transcript_3608/g.11872  ORF Transcript_3608/g.11872 Transcript_3608/m.11872 type:complete len:90 (-) Transcript_3608:1437-1706(-)
MPTKNQKQKEKVSTPPQDGTVTESGNDLQQEQKEQQEPQHQQQKPVTMEAFAELVQAMQSMQASLGPPSRNNWHFETTCRKTSRISPRP